MAGWEGPNSDDVGVGFATGGCGEAGMSTDVGRSPMGRRTDGRVDCPARGVPVSDMVRESASRPLVSANAPDERIVPGIAALGTSDPPLRALSFDFEELPVPGRPTDPGSVAAREWPIVPSAVVNEDELALPSSERCGATELTRERLDAFEASWLTSIGASDVDGAGDGASEMGEMGGLFIDCSHRSLPVLFGRRSCGAESNISLSALSSTIPTELRLCKLVLSMLRPSSAREGNRGTGGTDDDRALPGDALLARLSRPYGELIRGCSPRGRVAESCRPLPDLYLERRDSLERMNELTTNARARLVPETAEDMSSVTEEEGLDGRLLFVGSGGGISSELTSFPSSTDR